MLSALNQLIFFTSRGEITQSFYEVLGLVKRDFKAPWIIVAQKIYEITLSEYPNPGHPVSSACSFDTG